MNNFWKWILGIVIVLVVLFGLGIGSRLLMGTYLPGRTVGVGEITRPMMVRVDGSGDFDGLRGPMVVGSSGIGACGGLMHHGGGFMTLGWLVPLIFIGLLVYGAYRWGFRKSQAVQASLASVAPAAFRACTHCGHQVQEGWSHCANCGKKL